MIGLPTARPSRTDSLLAGTPRTSTPPRDHSVLTVCAIANVLGLLRIRGEQAATALEANLNNLESKLDALLAAMDSIEDDQAAPSRLAEPSTSNVAESTGDGEDKGKSIAKDTAS